MRQNKKGQSTLEYVILVTAVIVIMIALLGPAGPFRQTLNNTVGKAVGQIETVGDRWTP